jgi:hypothetical protein
MGAEVTKAMALDMQVCVPSEWTDEDVLKFANENNACGTEHGWHIRKQGDQALAGYPERNPCEARSGYVHIMLDA